MVTTPEYVTFGEAARLTGISKYRIAVVARRARLPVYRSKLDRRRKYLRREDVPRLTTPVLPEELER